MKVYQVRLSDQARRDVEDMYDYILKKDSQANAEYVLDNIEALIVNLARSPERGHHPEELMRHGIKEYREVFFKPYRIIYEVVDSKVLVHVCVDGRRDMRTLLERRFFR